MSITAARFFGADPKSIRPAQEDRFFNELKTGNATFKTTASDRFADLDAACIAFLKQSTRPIREVLDIGVSSGTTTLALGERLGEQDIQASILGTDVAVGGHIVPVLPGVRTLVDEAGTPIQHDILGIAIRPWFRRADNFTGMRRVRKILNATLGGRARRLVEAGSPGTTAVDLISPRLAAAPGISVVRNDIFVESPEFVNRFDFVRAANVLNPGYFPEDQLRIGIANAIRYLAGPGAWLLLARSVKNRHIASLLRVSDDGLRLEVVDRFNGGSEVEWLALETRLPHWAS